MPSGGWGHSAGDVFRLRDPSVAIIGQTPCLDVVCHAHVFWVECPVVAMACNLK